MSSCPTKKKYYKCICYKKNEQTLKKRYGCWVGDLGDIGQMYHIC